MHGGTVHLGNKIPLSTRTSGILNIVHSAYQTSLKWPDGVWTFDGRIQSNPTASTT